ncbi:SDR family oxidoreductase [Flavimaricola marinus]|uniref:UDP-glucose 4-epimerase n=1 Tax=Flavimaricola marinus TaxID=1819565 RepID=A0A238LAN4_9RHOB|nr:aldehyde reductase [Flavimaricola marinus]SMY06484.1 UDP-glucose 4-epimerase [Flavimaricola marinus]
MTQTILLTGASGYIGKHIAAQLLNAGYAVRGSVRRLDRADEVRAAVSPVLTDPASLERLSFVALDLTRDDGWTQAMEGVDAVLHTASPFPLAQPKDEEELIRPAVDGALRALRAAHAAGVRRVVLTSSVAAVMGAGGAGDSRFDESDWTDPTDPDVAAYSRSKTLAEKAAWDFVANEAPEIALTTINPSLVIGPPLDRHYGSSISVVERMLRAKDPALPNMGFPSVDVRDVAKLHVDALSTPASEGKRVIASEQFMWFVEMAETLKDAYPDRKIVTRRAPNFMIRLIALFDPAIRSILPSLGKRQDVSGDRARNLFGMTFLDSRQSLRDTASFLIQNKLV